MIDQSCAGWVCVFNSIWKRLEHYLLTYYIGDPLRLVFSENIGLILSVNKFNVLIYADDIVLF